MVLCACATENATCTASTTNAPKIANLRIVVLPSMWELSPPVTPTALPSMCGCRTPTLASFAALRVAHSALRAVGRALVAPEGEAASPFQIGCEQREWPGHNEIDERDGREHFDRAEILRRQQPAAVHDLRQRDHGGERRLLEQANECIAGGRVNQPQRLRQDHPPETLSIGQADHLACIPLTARNRDDRAAENFRHLRSEEHTSELQ